MDLLKNDKIGKTIKKELVRAMLERSQTVDVVGFSSSNVGYKDIQYDDVEELLNIPYINHEEVPLAMDIFKPSIEDNRELPVIVTIHGGGLTMGDRHISRPFGRLLAHKGYLVFSIEYRLAPRANVCQELDDVCAGLDCIGRKLVDFDVDFNRIYMAAESSGAYLALYVTAMKDSVVLQNAIGHEASRMRFRALYLNCGMFYTNRNDPCGWMLSEQIYGDKTTDEDFLQYMDPEHPEILYNLPPVMLTTCRGDFLNNYSIMLHDALKKAGKTCKLIYYPDDELIHAFLTVQTYHPRTLESIDRMLEWFEEHAKTGKYETETEKKRKKLNTRLKNGTVCKQNVSGFIREVRSADQALLNSIAVIDCTREYTYRQMFDEWDSYARVFSALGMTAENRSRVGIAGSISAEPLFAFYALNMTGASVSMLSYPDFLPTGMWKTMVKAEKMTDLIISDIMVTPDLWREIMQAREELGLRNIILIHSLLGGPCTGPAELVFNEFNHHALKRMEGTVFMDDLLVKYPDAEIYAAKADPERLALITHTSGTTKGTRKPLPFTNLAVNISAADYMQGQRSLILGNSAHSRLRVAPSFDFSSFFNMCGLINSSLTSGDTVVLTFFGFLHPKFIRAVKYYKLNVIFTSGFMLDRWMQTDDPGHIDFSTITNFGCGGSYIPQDKLRKYNEYIKKNGCRVSITRGYGMSETGGEQLALSPDCVEDILGYPINKDNYRILDENDGQFYTLDDGLRTGVLYVASGSLCSNTLDGEELFEFTKIDGRDFICTNDLVRLNEDGSLSYAGRADRYFVNNEGIRFDPGVVEVRISSQPCVAQCAVVPVLDKRIHDTVPVLYIIPEEKGEKAAEQVRQALVNVFVTEGGINATNLPSQFVLVDEIPCNASGKIDIYRITRDRLKGKAYNIVPVKEENELTDISIEEVGELNSITAGILPDGRAEGSALALYDMFNVPQNNSGDTSAFNPFELPKLFSKPGKGKKKMDIKPPEKLMKSATKIMGKLYKMKDFDHYFEI